MTECPRQHSEKKESVYYPVFMIERWPTKERKDRLLCTYYCTSIDLINWSYKTEDALLFSDPEKAKEIARFVKQNQYPEETILVRFYNLQPTGILEHIE